MCWRLRECSIRCVANQVSEWICKIVRVNERMKELLRHCVKVSFKMCLNVWIFKWVDKCKLSIINWNDCFFKLVDGFIYWLVGWLVVSGWMGEGGREGGSKRAGEWASEGGREVGTQMYGCQNDHFINVRLSLDRVLTTRFDWFEVSLGLNFVECVSNGKLSSVIIQFNLVRYFRT